MLEYIILGIIQGITEFLPISSSGHLVIAQKIFGITGQEMSIPVVMHLGTLLAVVIFFFRDILALFSDRKMLIFIMLVTLITGVIGVLGKEFFESLFRSAYSVGWMLVVTGIILCFTRRFMTASRKDFNIKDAFSLGGAQALAIIPGISRSGITIAALLFRNLHRQECFRVSFLASIPAVLGAALLEGKHITLQQVQWGHITAGFFSSLFTGILSLWLLQKVIAKAKLHYFGYYCILMGLVVVLFLGK